MTEYRYKITDTEEGRRVAAMTPREFYEFMKEREEAGQEDES